MATKKKAAKKPAAKKASPKKKTVKKAVAEKPAVVEETQITAIESKIEPIKAEIGTLKERAEAMVIKDDKDYQAASDALDVVSSQAKAAEKMRKFFVDPLNAQVKNINALFKPQKVAAEEVVGIIKGKMSAYFTEQEEKRLKEAARLQAIRDKADAKRAEQGKEAIAEPVREVAAPAKTISTGASKAQVRKVWKHKIVSINELPDDVKQAIFAEAYKKGIITTVINKFIKAGIREMSGVEIFQENQIASGNVREY